MKYKYLQPKRGSRYQQLAVGGRIRAEILYRETLGTEPLTPEQVAEEYDLPVDAVLEAILYCEPGAAGRRAGSRAGDYRGPWPRSKATCPSNPAGPMNLYLDDNSNKASLVNLLRRAGHQVTVPANLGLARDMKDRDIVRALVNLEGAQVQIENDFHILNHWR